MKRFSLLTVLGLSLCVTASATARAQDMGTQPPGTQDPAAGDQVPTDPPIPPDTELVTLPSGLSYSLLQHGAADAEKPSMGDQIRVHYTGWTTEGRVFDSSRKPQYAGAPIEPVSFALGQVIEGWNEGMQHCPVGGRIKLTVPSKLAYGERAIPQVGITSGATLIFDVELLAIEQRALPPVAWPTDADQIQSSPSGLKWHVIEAGTGEPLTGRFAVAAYTVRNVGGGWVAASTYPLPRTPLNGPVVFGTGQLPARFLSEAQGLLRAGSRVLFLVPPDLAFGKRELPNLPPGSQSLWQVQVVSVLDATKPEFTLPADDELKTTPSGLKYKVLREGTGRQPKVSSTVLAHYTGWLTKGTQFDSSWDRGAPISFPLTGVVAGWTEGLQLVKEGGRILLVIPPALGYGAAGKGSVPPDATMVFVIDLLTST
jgi:FKBP-type peptidyl-prolyl cis-trans isomerase